MINHKVKPNFFIVGAPKCGTTSIYSSLKQHPDIFMPEIKEPHYFGTDLTRKRNIYDYTLETYLKLFEGSDNYKIKGEASTYYLYSKNAAYEIYSFNPNSKILILLREPSEMIYSMHSQYKYSQNEDENNFERALTLEKNRIKKMNLPPLIDLDEKVYYKNYITVIPSRINQFINTFGKKQILVLLLDNIKNNYKSEYKKILEFLEVDNRFNPIYINTNPNKKIKILFIQKLIKKYGYFLGNLRKYLFSDKPIGIISFLDKINTYFEPRKKMNIELRKKLKQEFSSIVNEIEKIIKQDLSKWKFND